VGVILPIDKDVRGLQIAVNDSVAVGVVDGHGRVAKHGDLLAQGDRALAAPLGQLLALDELHRNEAAAVDDAGLIDADDLRMLGQVRAQSRFSDEALFFERRFLGIAVEAAQKHLEGDPAVELGVFGFIDDAHAAAPELAHDDVLAQTLQGCARKDVQLRRGKETLVDEGRADVGMGRAGSGQLQKHVRELVRGDEPHLDRLLPDGVVQAGKVRAMFFSHGTCHSSEILLSWTPSRRESGEKSDT
jgi:hypothetical protein